MNVRTSRKVIKDYLERLPYGLGAEFVIPAVRLVLRWPPIGLYLRTKNIVDVKIEAKKILFALSKNKMKMAVIVYDNLVSPASYGDFVFVVMLARYFIARNISVNFFIVDLEYRLEWNELDETEKKEYTTYQIQIAQQLLKSPMAKVEALTWEQFTQRISDIDPANVFMLFRNRVMNRESIYSSSLNVLNHLVYPMGEEFVQRFLLSFSEIAQGVRVMRPKCPYITWNCRNEEKYGGEGRNTSSDEFLAIYGKLKELYPRHAIMVVSDLKGCEHFKTLAHRHGLKCLFSKDFAETNFIADGALILGSDYFFVLRGGGISVFPMFSRLPHERIVPVVHEKTWRVGKATSWATEQQVYKNIRRSDTAIHLPSGSIRLE